ncbi:hypothetical protein CCHR01_15271 [Colletotrichum chrysophilum]|uniref:Uncharacterized protein n=1 Tax=Colletotrichum chrysophilum TaxID=1836956 RepID=A0AAD9A6H6_9PEZI|nr:hypothetical protein CCHR01_15271 [Colletotrichum chrysophilum]
MRPTPPLDESSSSSSSSSSASETGVLHRNGIATAPTRDRQTENVINGLPAGDPCSLPCSSPFGARKETPELLLGCCSSMAGSSSIRAQPLTACLLHEEDSANGRYDVPEGCLKHVGTPFVGSCSSISSMLHANPSVQFVCIRTHSTL